MALSATQFLGAKLNVSSREVVATPARDITVRAIFKKAGKSGTQAVKSKTFRNQELYGRDLWLPATEPPEWLDGSLVGDRGFDPLGLSKPAEYQQVDLDDLEQNDAVNKAGELLGDLKIVGVEVDSGNFQPYTEVFDINRFRECELQHGRWAMLGVLGAIAAELSTGVTWVDAIKLELDGPVFANLALPWSIDQAAVANSVLMLGIELFRNSETDLEKRQYPGGAFDPLNFTADPERALKLKESEIRHARLAMVAAFGFAAQAAFSGSTSPLDNLRAL